MSALDPYVSLSAGRNIEWKGHATKRAVRSAINWDSGRLRIFALGSDAEGWATYTEIPRERWVTYFAESEGPKGA